MPNKSKSMYADNITEPGTIQEPCEHSAGRERTQNSIMAPSMYSLFHDKYILLKPCSVDAAHCAASPEHIYFENGQPDQEKSRKNVAKRPFFGQNLRSEYGYLRPREASSAAISAPKSHAIALLTPWGHVGRGRWLWSGQIHLPWPSRALKMDKKIVENLALRCSLRQPCGKFAG